MADNETRIRITAVDDATRVLNSISGATKGLASDFGRLGAALGAIGVTGALAGISAMVKGAIDAAASMGDLSQKTGIAVKELTALDYAMRREGVSTEAFAKGIKELSKNLTEAGDATSKAGRIFKLLGVDASAGPREALLKIADAFQSLPDGATKATLAAELFGKAGLDLIPALNNGAAGIREIEEEARRLGITFGGETARRAKEFQDNVFALQESSKALGVELAEKLLPGLTNISRAMKEAAQDGGLLKAAWIGLGGVLAEALGITGDESRKTQARIKELGDEIARLSEVKVRDLGGGVLDKAAWIQAQEGIKAAREEIQYLLRLQRALDDAAAGKFQDSSDRRQQQGRDLSLGANVGRILREGSEKKPEADPARNLLISLQLEYTKLNSLTKENETLERVLAEFKKDAYAKADQGLKNQAIAQAKLIDDLKKRITAEQFLSELNRKEIDAAEARGNALEDLSNKWSEGTEQLEQELKLLGLTNLGREKAILLERARLDIIAAGDNAGAVRDIQENLARQLSLMDQIHLKQLDINKAVQDQASLASVWEEIASRGANFFADLAENGKEAFKSLRGSLKDFLRELIAMFAKRWILQLGAGLTGNAALAAQAAGVGEGSLVGAAGSMIGSGITGATGLAFSGAGLAQGFGLATSNIGVAGYFGGFGANAALAGSSLSAGSIGTAVGAMMPYLLPLLAVGALAYAFRDKGENWKGRIGFGAGANAYTTDGVFGREGFQYIAGNDATNRSIQAFMASTKPLDQQLAANLTPAQIAAITGSLATYNAAGARRADGQPAEFAFGKGDETAAQQLTLEYLQQKYGAVFDQIDTTFATFIRGYTGKSEDLLKEIGSFAAVLDGLNALDINGLDVAGLRGFQRAGETLEQTLQRIGGSWQQFEQLFTTDEERFAQATASIADTFSDLGIAIPGTKDEFEALVRGLDLSTEAGRTMFEALMAIAPAFAAVADAARASWMDLQSIINEYKPARTLSDAVGEFQSANPWAAGFTAAGLIEQLLTITEEDFGKYSAANQQLIKDILRLGRAANSTADSLDGASDAFSGVYGLSPGKLAQNRLNDEAQRLAKAFGDLRFSIRDYLDSLFTSDVSPLDPLSKLKFSEDRLFKLLAQANSGDLDAGQKLTGAADEVLRLVQEIYGSATPEAADYFKRITDALATFAGSPTYNQRLLTAADRTAELTEVVANLLDRIRRESNVNSDGIKQAVLQLAAGVPLGGR
jgi:hypothetical protein